MTNESKPQTSWQWACDKLLKAAGPRSKYPGYEDLWDTVAELIMTAYDTGRADAATQCQQVWVGITAEAEGGTPTAVGIANVMGEGARRCLAAISRSDPRFRS